MRFLFRSMSLTFLGTKNILVRLDQIFPSTWQNDAKWNCSRPAFKQAYFRHCFSMLPGHQPAGLRGARGALFEG